MRPNSVRAAPHSAGVLAGWVRNDEYLDKSIASSAKIDRRRACVSATDGGLDHVKSRNNFMNLCLPSGESRACNTRED